MGGGERSQLGVAQRRDAEPHDAVIFCIDEPGDEPGALSPVDELDGAVVAEEQVVSDVTDRGWRAVPPYDKQQLVLRTGDARCLRLLLTPAKEAPQAVPEREQPLEVVIRGRPLWRRHIVERYSCTL